MDDGPLPGEGREHRADFVEALPVKCERARRQAVGRSGSASPGPHSGPRNVSTTDGLGVPQLTLFAQLFHEPTWRPLPVSKPQS